MTQAPTNSTFDESVDPRAIQKQSRFDKLFLWTAIPIFFLAGVVSVLATFRFMLEMTQGDGLRPTSTLDGLDLGVIGAWVGWALVLIVVCGLTAAAFGRLAQTAASSVKR